MRQVGLTFFNDFLIEEKLKYACDTTAAATEGEVVAEYADQMKLLVQKLLAWVSESLGLGPLRLKMLLVRFIRISPSVITLSAAGVNSWIISSF
ncbi:unnamed protein product [Rhodiola kirilowii]